LLRDPGAARDASGPRAAADAAPWPAIIGAVVLDVTPPGTPRRGADAAVRRELGGWPVPPAPADLLRSRGLLRPAELPAMGPAVRPVEAARAALGLPDRQLVEALAAAPPGGAAPGRTAPGFPLTARDGYVRTAAGAAPPGPAAGQRRSAASSPAAAGPGPDPQ